MPKVLLHSTQRAGVTKRVDARLAEVLIRRGGWERAEAASTPATPASPDYATMAYNDLRRIAAERGLGLGRATKDELVAALSKGRYQRRDMRAAK